MNFLRRMGIRNIRRAQRTVYRITRDTPAAKVHGLWLSADFHYTSADRLYFLATPEAQA